MKVNNHGLSRKPPLDIKRIIRQNSGFGCVICGVGIYDYEHVDPEFKDAREHDPDKMTLLCLQCHGKVTRKIWSKEKVKSAMREPRCKQIGYSNEMFDFGANLPSIKFAGVTLMNCQIPVEVFGDPLFEIKLPEEGSSFFRLSANFYNSAGNDSLQIIDNEWFAFTENWDVEIVGPVITVREAKGEINLKLIAHPPTGISVDRLNMLYKDIKFSGNADFLKIIFSDGREREFRNNFSNGFPVALSIGSPSKYVAGIII